ncbi:hypothetical protein NQZ68_035966 [Dissostichus eleginoides]|nr:hypothetical protein NQZ68_035966 [Dissostichus eleginoides]
MSKMLICCTSSIGGTFVVELDAAWREKVMKEMGCWPTGLAFTFSARTVGSEDGKTGEAPERREKEVKKKKGRQNGALHHAVSKVRMRKIHPPPPCKRQSNRGHSGDDGRGICHALSLGSLLLSRGPLLSSAPQLAG